MRFAMILAVLALAACEGPSRAQSARQQQVDTPKAGISVSGYARYGVSGRL
ncbi:MAG: hypothetical protein ABJN72_02940 [Sulfitobacter sp.]